MWKARVGGHTCHGLDNKSGQKDTEAIILTFLKVEKFNPLNLYPLKDCPLQNSSNSSDSNKFLLFSIFSIKFELQNFYPRGNFF